MLQCIEKLIAEGGMDLILSALETDPSALVVQNALMLLSTVALDEKNLSELRSRNAVDIVVQAM